MLSVTNASDMVEERDQHGNLVMSLGSIGLAACVRFKRFPDGVKFSEIDVVKAVTGKNNNDSGLIVRRVAENNPDKLAEVRSGSIQDKFKGPGQKDTKLITYQGVLKLIMILPGINAKEIRGKFVSVLQRYFAGDPTLVEELVENNVSSDPIHQLAREDGGIPSLAEGESGVGMKRGITMTLEELDKYAQAQHENNMQMLKFQRRLALNDAKMEEIRKENDRKKELEFLKEKIEMEEKSYEKKAMIDFKYKKEDREHMLRVEKELMKLRVLATTTTTTTTTEPVATGPAPFEGPVTVCRVAEHYNLLRLVPSGLKDQVLAKAGRSLPKEPYSLVPLPTKVKHINGKYDVYQYLSADMGAVKDAIAAAVRESVGVNQTAVTDFFFH